MINTKCLIKYLLIIQLFFSIFSCRSSTDNIGYIFDDNNFDFIKKNVTSKATLIKTFGSPSIETFINNEEYWIYYAEDIKKFLFFKPTIISRKVIILKFHEDRVNYIKNLDLKDADYKYFMNINKTFVPHHNANILMEIIQNVGVIKP